MKRGRETFGSHGYSKARGTHTAANQPWGQPAADKEATVVVYIRCIRKYLMMRSRAVRLLSRRCPPFVCCLFTFDPRRCSPYLDLHHPGACTQRPRVPSQQRRCRSPRPRKPRPPPLVPLLRPPLRVLLLLLLLRRRLLLLCRLPPNTTGASDGQVEGAARAEPDGVGEPRGLQPAAVDPDERAGGVGAGMVAGGDGAGRGAEPGDPRRVG